MRRNFPLIVLVLIIMAVIHTGSIRKPKTAIQKTQTDPIKYEQKMEELKDGEKGAPSPSFVIYPKERFFLEPPMVKGGNYRLGEFRDLIPEMGAPIPEDLAGAEEPEVWEEGWWGAAEDTSDPEGGSGWWE